MKTLITAAALALAATGALAQDTVRIGTEGAYPPYNYLNDAGELEGFEIVLGNEVCKRAGLTCEWVQNDWDSIIPNLSSGNYDVIMAGMNITEEREELVDFTQNYFPPASSAYVALSTDVDITTATVSAQTNTVQSAYIAGTGATLVEYATPEETVAAVRNGEVDAVFADIDFLEPLVDQSGGGLVIVDQSVQIGDGVGAAFRTGDERREVFDRVIGEMKADGSLNALLKEWFGDDQVVYE